MSLDVLCLLQFAVIAVLKGPLVVYSLKNHIVLVLPLLFMAYSLLLLFYWPIATLYIA